MWKTPVKIRTREVEAFTKHISAVGNNIKFMLDDVRRDNLLFLQRAVHIKEDRNLNITTHWGISFAYW